MNILKNRENLNNNHIFYRAVVENRVDPELLGRVQVRILGLHSADKNDNRTPTENLPWAEIMSTTQFGGINSGIGMTSIPLNGTWVWVFLDAGDFNRPIVIGSMFGIPTLSLPDEIENQGFFDPDGIYPLEGRLNEPDTNRLARNEGFELTRINLIKDLNRDEGISTATGKIWDELEECTSSAEYPNNTVIETPTHNFVEYDDTDGNSRIHFFHNTGTYWEMVDNGDYSIKVVGETFSIHDLDSYRLNKMSEYITVRENQEYKIDGNQDIVIAGYSNENITGDLTQVYDAKLTTSVTGACKETYSAGQVTDGGPSIKITAGTINLN